MAGEARGFTCVEHYLQHSRCIVFVARKLAANQDALAARRLRYYPSSDAEPTLPGSSLYLFERRAPISINLRLAMQCVMLAQDAAEGGVHASFLRDLNAGALGLTVPCANYRTPDPSSTMALRRWLRRETFLQLESVQLCSLQISRDVFASVRLALSQLPVFDMPDLVCVAMVDGWTVGEQSVLASSQGRESATLHFYRNPALAFAIGVEGTSVGRMRAA